MIKRVLVGLNQREACESKRLGEIEVLEEKKKRGCRLP